MSFVTNKININPDFRYIISQYIREYDISKCNINMLLVDGVIDKELYDKLYNSDRMYREVYVGNMIKNNKEIYKVISNGVIKYRNILFEANNVEESDILTIKNDAVFTVNKILDITTFDNYITFKNKETYTSFFKITNLELYYNINTDKLDVKGIKDDRLSKHQEFIELLKTIIYLIEMGLLKDASNMINEYYYKYITCNIDIGFMRNFDNISAFFHVDYPGYVFDIPPDNNIEKYNAVKNIYILIEFNKIVNSLLLSNTRHLR